MSNLQFQEPAFTNVPLRLKSFYGRNIDQIPLLLSGKNEAGETVDIKRVVITPKQVLSDRINGTNEIDMKLLRDNYVDTGAAVIVDPNGSGEAIIGLYSNPAVKELVHSLDSKTNLVKGSLQISNDQYQAIRKDAYVISADAANSLRNDGYNENKVREGFWEYIAEGDAKLVKDTLKLVQDTKKGNFDNRMGLYLSSNEGLWLLCVGAVGDDNSSAFGYYSLNGSYGRLVGVAAEPLARENLETKLGKTITSALDARKPFEFNGTIYAPVQGVALK